MVAITMTPDITIMTTAAVGLIPVITCDVPDSAEKEMDMEKKAGPRWDLKGHIQLTGIV